MALSRKVWFCLILAFLWAPATFAQTTPTPSATLSAAPTIQLGDISSSLQDYNKRIQDLSDALNADDILTTVQASLPQLTKDIDAQLKEDDRILQTRTDLESLGTLNTKWAAINTNIAPWRDALASRVNQLDDQIKQVDKLISTWKATQQEASGAGLTAEVDASIMSAQTAANQLESRMKTRRALVVAVQSSLDTQAARINDAKARLVQARSQTVTQVFDRDALPLWDGKIVSQIGTSLLFDIYGSWANEVDSLLTYLAARWLTLLGVLVAFFVLYMTLDRARQWAMLHADKHTDLETALVVLHKPVATALLLAVLIHRWLNPTAPRLLLAGLGGVILIPAVLLLRGLLDKHLWPLLTALVTAYFVDQLRIIAAPVPLLARLLLLLETAGGAAFLGSFLITARRQPIVEPQTPLKGVLPPLMIVLKLVFWLFSVTAIANLGGYFALANLLGQGLLSSIYFAVILYGILKTTDALLVLALRIPPLSRLHYVNNHAVGIRRNTMNLLALLAALTWVLSILEFLSLRAPVVDTLEGFMTAPFGVGSLQTTLGGIIASIIVIWGAVQLSKFFLAALQEDVYPHVNLGRGVPYALSTTLHYIILTIGIIAGLAALGVDSTKLTVVAGALSVGIGFGLQNIINNFVSGMILLFDRPVNVGDMVTLGDARGRLRHIGLRTSTLSLGDGSEIIVPNSDLINQKVINWSADGIKIRIDIKLSVSVESDVQSVIQLLNKTALECPGIGPLPAPKTLLLTFTAKQFDLQLSAWAQDQAQLAEVKSELSLRLQRGLKEAGIELV